MKRTGITTWITPEQKNKLYEEGFRFYARYHWRDKGVDNEGYPIYKQEIIAFVNRYEASEFKEDIDPYNTLDRVMEIPKHTLTKKEEEEKKAKAKAKAEETKNNNAQAMGFTREAYDEYNKVKSQMASLESRIAKETKWIEEAKKHIKEMSEKLETLKLRKQTLVEEQTTRH